MRLLLCHISVHFLARYALEASLDAWNGFQVTAVYQGARDQESQNEREGILHLLHSADEPMRRVPLDWVRG